MTDKDFELEDFLADVVKDDLDLAKAEEELVVDEVEQPEEAVEVVEEKPKKAKKSVVDDGSVAIFSNGAIYQAKWGEISKGYNIVSKEAATYWLSHTSRVRLATPEEVAKHYGIK